MLLRGFFFTGVLYDDLLFKFELKDIKIRIYNGDKKLIDILDNVKKICQEYNIPRSTLSDYIKSGKLYKNKYYFYKNNI